MGILADPQQVGAEYRQKLGFNGGLASRIGGCLVVHGVCSLEFADP
jgi:hypothetical protein